jgi:multiple sugar transport system substrate-binding protein
MIKYYQKFIEKSRLFCMNHFGGRRIDIILLVAAVAVFAVLLVGPSFKKAASISKRTEIVVPPQCESLFGKDTFSALVQEFEGQNPGIRVVTASGGEKAEDIVFFDGGEFRQLLNGTSLISLAPYVDAGAEEDTLALPLFFFMDLFFYNIDILKAADCDRPPKTRADFLAVAQAVAKTGNAFPLALGFGGDPAGTGIPGQALRRDLYPWIWADNARIGGNAPSGEEAFSKEGALSVKGIDLLLADTSVPAPALSRISTNAISFFDQLNREGLLAPGTFEKTGEQRLREFAEGKIAMMAGSARDIPFLKKNAKDIDFGITAMPAAAQGKNRLGLSGVYAGISSSCTQPDEAWAFLAFIAGKNQILARGLEAVPGCFPSAFPADYIVNDPLYAKAWDILEAAEIVDQYGPSSVDDISLYDEADRLLREKLTEIPFN